MALIDARWRIAFWRDPLSAGVAVGVGTAMLLVWDLVGIGFGVFFRGESIWATGLLLAPELPIEEPVFLAFLCYLSLIVVLGVERLLAARRSSRRSDRTSPTAGTVELGADAAREART
ncbi:hypothetical protein ATC03_11715 [Agromyces aureus]|uniref:Lycopene cyclase domain-containing protein n=2 Tax=Agromyces aureus TaxID=453304 RepID=A0A191WKY3_9MICO|nr:hypothetical protein ATC03_11715 [Agromyces aureus]